MAVPGWAVEIPPKEVPPAIHILLYHRFDEPQYGATSTDGHDFQRQLAVLKGLGYRFLSLPEFKAIVAGQTPWPRAPLVMVTIDDPYRSVLRGAVPILQKEQIPWVLAVNTEPLEKGWPDFMAWDDVERLAKQGVAILNHGHTHMAWEGAVVEARNDRVQARKLLKQHGIATQGVVYPYGRYDVANLVALKRQGERWGFTQDPGVVGPELNRLLIPRTAVAGLDLAMFEERLRLLPLAVAKSSPAPGGALPADRRVRGQILHPERYEGGLNLFVSGLGAIQVDYDVATGAFVSEPLPPLVRSVTRIKASLKLRGKGRFALASWRILDESGQEKGPPEGGPDLIEH